MYLSNLLLKWSNKVGREYSRVSAEFAHPPVRMLLWQNGDDVAFHKAELVWLLGLVVVQSHPLTESTTAGYNHQTIRQQHQQQAAAVLSAKDRITTATYQITLAHNGLGDGPKIAPWGIWATT